MEGGVGPDSGLRDPDWCRASKSIRGLEDPSRAQPTPPWPSLPWDRYFDTKPRSPATGTTDRNGKNSSLPFIAATRETTKTKTSLFLDTHHSLRQRQRSLTVIAQQFFNNSCPANV